MTALENKPLPMDAEVVGSRIGRIDPDIFRSPEADSDNGQVAEDSPAENDSEEEPAAE